MKLRKYDGLRQIKYHKEIEKILLLIEKNFIENFFDLQIDLLQRDLSYVDDVNKRISNVIDILSKFPVEVSPLRREGKEPTKLESNDFMRISLLEKKYPDEKKSISIASLELFVSEQRQFIDELRDGKKFFSSSQAVDKNQFLLYKMEKILEKSSEAPDFKIVQALKTASDCLRYTEENKHDVSKIKKLIYSIFDKFFPSAHRKINKTICRLHERYSPASRTA